MSLHMELGEFGNVRERVRRRELIARERKLFPGGNFSRWKCNTMLHEDNGKATYDCRLCEAIQSSTSRRDNSKHLALFPTTSITQYQLQWSIVASQSKAQGGKLLFLSTICYAMQVCVVEEDSRKWYPLGLSRGGTMVMQDSHLS